MARSADAAARGRPSAAFRLAIWVSGLVLCTALLAGCGRTVVRAEGSESRLERWSVGIEF